ncbi:MAG TPA: hypothetical protein VHT34_06610 [Clostridia bacterium]|nr:hypothetical protein [Clostridia bacterium]
MLTKSKSSKKIICSILAVVFIATSLSISAFATTVTESKNASSTVYYNISCPDYVISSQINTIVNAAPKTKDYSEGAGGFSGTLSYSNYYIASNTPVGYPVPDYIRNCTIALVYTGTVSRTVDYPESKTVTSTTTYNITCPSDQIQNIINSISRSNPTKSYSEPHYSAVLPLTSSYISSQSPYSNTYPYYPSNLYNYTVTLVYSGIVNYQP